MSKLIFKSSKLREHLADITAVRRTNYPPRMINALVKVVYESSKDFIKKNKIPENIQAPFFDIEIETHPRVWQKIYLICETTKTPLPNYLTYMLSGMISILMMTMSVFASMSLVFDKRVGYLKRLLTTPAPKSAIGLAKALGAVTRGILTMSILLFLGVVLGVQFMVNLIALLEWFISLIAVGIGFSLIFMALTANTSDIQAPGAVMNLITMPLMFTSTALFPKQFSHFGYR